MISAVAGTAATGAPIGSRTVTLKDSRGEALTQTTAADGSFAFSTGNLVPPLFLQVTTASGRVLHSITAASSSTATVTANVTPYTDGVVRLYYGVQGIPVESVFSSPVGQPMPTRRQLRAAAEALQRSVQLGVARHGAPVVEALDFIEKPFRADGSGMDRLLDNTQYTVSGNVPPLKFTIGMGAESTVANLQTYPSTSTIYVEGETRSAGMRVDGFRTFNNLPTKAASIAAMEKIDDLVDRLAAAARTSPTVESLEPLFDPDALYGGRDRRAYLTELAADLAQRPGLSLSVRRLGAGDPIAAGGRSQLELRATSSLPGASQLRQQFFHVKQGAGGAWSFTGDGFVAEVNATAETRINQVRGGACDETPTYCDRNGMAAYLDVRAPVQSLASVAATMSRLGPTWVVPLTKSASPEQTAAGVFRDVFEAAPQPMDLTWSLFVLTVEANLQRVDGTTSTPYLQPSALTMDQVRFTNVETSCRPQPGDTPQQQRCTVAEGKPVPLTWTLPTTFAISSVRLLAVKHAVAPDSQCTLEGPLLPIDATSAQLTVPAGGCFGGGSWDSVDFMLVVQGLNGERSVAVARYGRFQP